MRLKSIQGLIFILLPILILAQDGPASSGYNGLAVGVPIMSDEYRMQLLNNEDDGSKMEFYHLTYQTPTLNLNRIKTYSQYQIPEKVEIVPPDLSEFDHVVVLIGLSGTKKEPRMIIWLAGNYNYDEVTFFMDYDQDRNFTDDNQPPIQMISSNRPKQVTLSTPYGKETLWLSVPKQKAKIKKPRIRVADAFLFGVNAGIGNGELTYIITGSNLPNYYVNISEKNLGVSLAYYSKVFLVGMSSSFQNHYFYASYSVGTLNVNRDLHTRNKMHFSLYGALRIPLGSYIELQPVFKYGGAQYFNPEYKLSRYSDESFDLGFSRFHEYGMRIEFTLGRGNAFYLEYAINKQNWEPEGITEGLGNELISDLRVNKFNLGYQISF